MPFEGPQGQGPFTDFDDCVSSMEDEEGIDDPEALCAAWKEESEQAATPRAEYRTVYQPDPSRVQYREVEAEEDGLFAVRMPIASTGAVRNEGDEPLERDELAGMATQINEGDVGVFLAHGRSFEISDARYGQTERLGSWQDAEIVTASEREDGDDADLLEATAVMADPEELPAATGRYRETLAILKEQAKLNIPMSSSIGWREDESAAGGNDLMEASIVGIPADPRTNNTKALARAAVDAGADPEAFVAEVRSAVMGTTADQPDSDMTDDAEDPPETIEEHGRTYVLREADGDTTDDEQDERQDAPEWAAEMLELLRDTNSTLGELAEEIRQDDDEDDDDEEENETDEDDDDEDEEQAADEVDELREALTALREGGVDVSDVKLPDADDEQDADDAEDDAAAPAEDPIKKRLR